MIQYIKRIIPLLFFVVTFSSCLTSEEKIERTYEMELADLNNFLVQLEEDGYNIDTTDLGVYYIIDTEGSGLYPKQGDTVTVEYVGAFITGTVFDASINHWEDGLWTFQYKENNLIPGFEDVLSVMQKGTALDAIIPSPLGYGTAGAGNIPPYTTLLFSMKLHDLRPKADN